VPCYSCDYDSDRGGGDYHVAINGVFTGYKWQCVEFARRYLVMTSQFTFASIPMAYHIFQLDFVVRVSDNIKFPLIPCVNGSTRHPRAGELLIWRAGGKKIGRTGHGTLINFLSNQNMCCSDCLAILQLRLSWKRALSG
jgi:glutathionylspermidine amidase/synthetase